MARQNPHQSFGKILTLVFGVAFAIIALVMVYKAVQDSTENRSKAAEEQITYKQWEFNGKDTEGWKVPVGSTVRSGYLNLPPLYQVNLMYVDGSSKQIVLSIDNTAVNTVFPVGNKQIKIMVAVGVPREETIGAINANPPVSTTVVGESSLGSGPGGPASSVITGITYEEQQKNNVRYPQYTMMVSYSNRENLQKYIQIPSVTGMADGRSHEIAITIPNSINEMRMGALNVQFTNVPPGSEVRIDWIRLVGPKGNITPSCKGDAVKSVTIENRCAGLKAKSASYQCADGFTGSVGDGTTCVSGNTLRLQVQKACAQHRSCPITPTPTPKKDCISLDEIRAAGRLCLNGGPCPELPPSDQICPPTPTPTKKCFSSCGGCIAEGESSDRVCPLNVRPEDGCYHSACALQADGSCGYTQPELNACLQMFKNPSSDCCSAEKKQQGYKCVKDCAPGSSSTTYSCLSSDIAAVRERFVCPP